MSSSLQGYRQAREKRDEPEEERPRAAVLTGNEIEVGPENHPDDYDHADHSAGAALLYQRGRSADLIPALACQAVDLVLCIRKTETGLLTQNLDRVDLAAGIHCRNDIVRYFDVVVVQDFQAATTSSKTYRSRTS